MVTHVNGPGTDDDVSLAAWEMRPHADALVGKGWELFVDGDEEAAAAACSDALRLDPRNVAALSLRSMALARLGKSDEALALALVAIAADAASARGYAARGTALLAAGRAGDAAEDFAFALALTPTCGLVFYQAARCWARLADEEACRRALTRAVELVPRFMTREAAKGAWGPFMV